MKIASMLQLALLLLAAHSQAATVEYHPPNLTIVASQEPLDAVLKSIGREMRIFITVPTGLNPTVNCNVQQQPVAQALNTLLKNVSYSLEWDKGGEQLAGITILADGPQSAVAPGSRGDASSQNAAAPAAIDVGGVGGSGVAVVGTSPSGVEQDTATVDHDAAMAEHEASMEAEREEMDARMAEERAAQEAKLKEEVARHDAQHQAELDAFLQSKGVSMPQ